jgi:hypothetical protein
MAEHKFSEDLRKSWELSQAGYNTRQIADEIEYSYTQCNRLHQFAKAFYGNEHLHAKEYFQELVELADKGKLSITTVDRFARHYVLTGEKLEIDHGRMQPHMSFVAPPKIIKSESTQTTGKRNNWNSGISALEGICFALSREGQIDKRIGPEEIDVWISRLAQVRRTLEATIKNLRSQNGETND